MAEILLSPRLQRFLKKDPDLLKKLKSALQNREAVIIEKSSNEKHISVDENPLTFLENRELEIITHDSKQQALLGSKIEQWMNLVTDLQNACICAIFTDDDLSKTYVCTNAVDLEPICAELFIFLDQKPGDIKTSASDRELGENKKDPSNSQVLLLNPSKTNIVKSEKMLTFCLTYLIENTQYEFMSHVKSVLKQTELKFQLKGSLNQSVIPIVIDVNRFTKLSCVLVDDIADSPVDSLIILTKNKPTEDYKPVCERHSYRIWQAADQTASTTPNLVVHAEFLESFDVSKLNHVLEDCLLCVYKSAFPVKVLGIQTSIDSSHYWKLFVNSLLRTVHHLDKEQTTIPYHYMILIIEKIESLAEFRNVFTEKSTFASEEEKDVEIRIIEGDLTKQKVDMIVNSTNVYFDLSHGTVSKALVNAAGPELQQECDRQTRFKWFSNDAIVTPGYSLPCNYIFHGILPMKYSPHVITTFFLKCMEAAANMKMSSIAFPALGTGNLGYPLEEVAKEMNEGLKFWKKKKYPNTLRDIRLVLFPGQTKIKETFTKVMLNDQLFPSQEERWMNNYEDKLLYWVHFIQIHGDPHKMDLGLKYFHLALQKVPFTVDDTELEDLLFFTNIIQLEPDIITQLSNFEEREIQLFVQKENLIQIRKLREEIKTKLKSKKVELKQRLNNKQIQILLQKLNQKFPLVKCEITDPNSFHFVALDLDLIQEAINLLESFLCLRESASTGQNLFGQAKQQEGKFGFNKEQSHFEELINLSTTNSEVEKFGLNKAKLQFEGLTSPSLNNKEENPENIGLGPVLTNQTQVPKPLKDLPLSSVPYGINPKKGLAPNAKIPNISCFQVDHEIVVKVYEDDFLNTKVEGIVNAANKHLAHVGGLAAHIIKHAGHAVDQEGKAKLNGKVLNVGDVISTSAGNLKYKNIIHAVGPQYSLISRNDSYCKTEIIKVVFKSLVNANQLGLKSVALPAISSDIFGVPLPICTEGYYEGVKEFILRKPTNYQLKEIHFVDRNVVRVEAIKQCFAKYFPESPMEITGNNGKQNNGARAKESII